ncbi:MAG: hypothetical protein U1E61_09140 [Bradyrhizobium sp.]
MTAVKDARLRAGNSAAMIGATSAKREFRHARVALFCLGWLAGIATVAVTLLAARAPGSARAADITLIYVGAEDCAPCRAWQRGDGATFRQSSDFAHLRYREVKAPHLHELLDDEYWPQDIRVFRDRLSAGSGVPLWLVVASDETVLLHQGASAWRSEVLPTLKRFQR